jgi:hypothetical protein
MMGKDALLRNRLSTLFHDAKLLSHVAESANDLLVAVVEREDSVWNLGFTAEFQYILLGLTEIMTWHARVKVVDSLELQTTVEKV